MRERSLVQIENTPTFVGVFYYAAETACGIT